MRRFLFFGGALVTGALTVLSAGTEQGTMRDLLRDIAEASDADWAAVARGEALAKVLATDTRDVASYRTLGLPNPSAQTRDAIAVMFDPGITESDLRRVVLGVGARIVDGPSSTDVFMLEIPAERTDRALEALRAEPGVRLAERLGPRTSR